KTDKLDAKRITLALRDGRILITSTNAGIGRASAEHFASHGFKVYGGVRKGTNFQELADLSNNTFVTLDVTIKEFIQEASAYIKKK
ncbi:MAG: hypothetical protein ACOC35_10325, partial [Promethearchaeia archaeon]